MRTLDALVAGAGPAGLAAALALRRRGFAVLVVEAGAHDRAHDHGLAADTLRPEGRRLLRTLGVADAALRCPRVEGHGIRAAWDTPGITEQTFFPQPHGPAWHVERPAFDRALATVAEDAGATIWRGAALRGFARGRDVWRATLDAGGSTRAVEARTLIDATGRAARIARRLGSARLTYDRLVALWATFKPARATGSMLLLEATAGGWWYSIPLPGGRLLAAYVTDGDLLPRGVAPGEAWTAALTPARHTAARLRAGRRADDFRPAIRQPASAASRKQPVRDGSQWAMPRQRSIRCRARG